jgi:serine/threonine protein kinase
MSPEQAEGRLDLLGPASDVYGLGATLYCLLTGKPPVEGQDMAEVLKKVQCAKFATPRQIQADISPALEAICLKAMALKPQNRYAAPRELAEDIEHWLADEPVGAWAEPWSVKARRWGWAADCRSATLFRSGGRTVRSDTAEPPKVESDKKK